MTAADRPLAELERAQMRYSDAIAAMQGHHLGGDRAQELTEARDDLLRLEREAATDRREVPR
jgi:hypothetical protein